jgi:hypothetical protein
MTGRDSIFRGSFFRDSINRDSIMVNKKDQIKAMLFDPNENSTDVTNFRRNLAGL